VTSVLGTLGARDTHPFITVYRRQSEPARGRRTPTRPHYDVLIRPMLILQYDLIMLQYGLIMLQYGLIKGPSKLRARTSQRPKSQATRQKGAARSDRDHTSPGGALYRLREKPPRSHKGLIKGPDYREGLIIGLIIGRA
jgi:hypothetical protein